MGWLTHWSPRREVDELPGLGYPFRQGRHTRCLGSRFIWTSSPWTSFAANDYLFYRPPEIFIRLKNPSGVASVTGSNSKSSKFDSSSGLSQDSGFNSELGGTLRFFCDRSERRDFPLRESCGTPRPQAVVKDGATERRKKPDERPALFRTAGTELLFGVGEGEVGAEADHAEAGGGALARAEGGARFKFAFERSGAGDDEEIGGGVERDGQHA